MIQEFEHKAARPQNFAGFTECRGEDDTGGVPKNKHYRVIRWKGPGAIYFSYAQKGEAMTVHFASDAAGLRYLRAAFKDVIEWLFHHYSGCFMLFAIINPERGSIVRLVSKCGLNHYLSTPGHIVYVRTRQDG